MVEGGAAKSVTTELFCCGSQQERVKRRRSCDLCLPLCCQPRWSAPRTWLSSVHAVYAARGRWKETDTGTVHEMKREEEERSHIRTHRTASFWRNTAFHLNYSTKQSATLHIRANKSRLGQPDLRLHSAGPSLLTRTSQFLYRLLRCCQDRALQAFVFLLNSIQRWCDTYSQRLEDFMGYK